MSEKVIGFKEKNAVITALDTHFREGYFIDKRIKLVPVVSVEWLKRECEKKHKRQTVDLSDINWNLAKGNNEALESLLSSARKQARGECE